MVNSPRLLSDFEAFANGAQGFDLFRLLSSPNFPKATIAWSKIVRRLTKREVWVLALLLLKQLQEFRSRNRCNTCNEIHLYLRLSSPLLISFETWGRMVPSTVRFSRSEIMVFSLDDPPMRTKLLGRSRVHIRVEVPMANLGILPLTSDRLFTSSSYSMNHQTSTET